MARPKKNLNNKGTDYIKENLFAENPDGLPSIEDSMNKPVKVSRHIPEMRRIRFLNGRDPGYPLDFHYCTATHPLQHYTLYHGQEHDLPVEVIEHLENCAIPQYAYRQGRNGQPEMYNKTYTYLYRCQAIPQRRAA